MRNDRSFFSRSAGGERSGTAPEYYRSITGFGTLPDAVQAGAVLTTPGGFTLDGDWIVVHRTSEAKNGQIVVARVGNDVTVKRLKVRGSKAELIPANPDFQVLHLDLERDSLEIEGIAVGVIRNLMAGPAPSRGRRVSP